MSQNIAQILLQSLEKKNLVLDEIIAQNDLQEDILKQENLDMDALDASVQKIGDLVEELEKLDDGFESVYDRVRTEIMENKSMYRAEITQMQENIQQITDKVVKINAARMRNQLRAENHFKQKAGEIKQAVSKTKVANNYYNNMNKLNYVAPQFYDNKK
ncbi:MAG: flagellar protein FliT [Lachnospiraceae bacterium]|nr:flagellar protein FliT [Lachnospiraceae bacterium]